MSNVIDVGHGHTLTRLADADGSLYGFVDEHTSLKTGEPCSGSVCVNPGPDDVKYNRDVWTMESEEPLSLTPSLLCTTCGEHGFVRDGKWVPA